MSSFKWPPESVGIPVYANVAAFPSTGNTVGQQAVDASNIGNIYEWNGSSWVLTASSSSTNAITALTGDVTATGPGSVPATLATVNSNVGSFGTATQTSTVTVNAKGLVTAASNTAILITESQVTNLVSDLASKVAISSLGNLTDVGTDGIVVTGGTAAVVGNVSLAQHVADTTNNGYLSSTDWNTFNGKQASGNYITALTGDGTASGPGSAALTLATVNTNVGSFGTATQSGSFTVNAKGLITAASNTSIQIAESQVTNLVSDLAGKVSISSLGDLTDAGTDGIVVTGGTGAVVGAVSLAQHVADTTHNGYLSSTDWNTFNGKQTAGNYITALTGDATASGPGSAALTFATVNGNVGSFGSSTAIPSFTVNAKGLVTAASTNVVIAPAGTLTGTTLASNVVTSSLTAVGTITSGTWTGTTIAIANGGTGQVTASAAFNALSPITTAGDLILGTGVNTAGRLAIGGNATVLTSNGTTASWQAAGAGTVTSVSVVSANGFAGTVATATTTPAITLTTSITGILQGNGTAISAATTTGSGSVVLATSPALTTPALGTPSAIVLTNASGLTGAAFGSQSANTFLAGPSGSSGNPSFRVLATADFVAPTIQKFTSSSGTYTTPTSPRAPLYLKIKMVGGGGGGSGTASSTAGGTGGNTTFGTTLLVANGGVGGSSQATGGTGGTASLGSGPIGIALTGGQGGDAPATQVLNVYMIGASGASTPFGSGANGATSSGGTGVGYAAAANTGAGGGGGAPGSSAGLQYAGSGGGSGGFVDAIIFSPLSTYAYAVGASGTAGSGAGGFAGGAGGSGVIVVEEHYQ